MNRIRTLREASSMSQKELASAIGVPQSLVSYWEREKRTPSVVNAQKLTDFFWSGNKRYIRRKDCTIACQLLTWREVRMRNG